MIATRENLCGIYVIIFMIQLFYLFHRSVLTVEEGHI